MPRPRALQKAQTAKTPVARRKRKSPTSHAASTAGSAPSHEAIAARAYALFLARGAQHGSDWEDWIQAEGELRGAAGVLAEKSQGATTHCTVRTSPSGEHANLPDKSLNEAERGGMQ